MLNAPWSIACCAGISIIVCGVFSKGSVSLCNEGEEDCVLTTLTGGRVIVEFSFSSARAKAGKTANMQQAVVIIFRPGRLNGLNKVPIFNGQGPGC